MYIYSICIYIVILYSIFKGMYHPFLEFYRCHKFSWQKQKQFKACVTLAWKTTSFLGETFSYPKLPCLESIEQNWMNCIYLSLPQWESGVCNCKARTFKQQNYLSESKRMEFHHLQESVITRFDFCKRFLGFAASMRMEKVPKHSFSKKVTISWWWIPWNPNP